MAAEELGKPCGLRCQAGGSTQRVQPAQQKRANHGQEDAEQQAERKDRAAGTRALGGVFRLASHA